MQRVVLFAALAAMTVAGCADNPADALKNAPRPITEQRQLIAAPSTKLKVFDDCKSYGGGGCESGVCLQAGPDKFHCTRACKSDSECGGAGFECAQVYPSEEGWFCVRQHPNKSRGGRADAGASADAGKP